MLRLKLIVILEWLFGPVPDFSGQMEYAMESRFQNGNKFVLIRFFIRFQILSPMKKSQFCPTSLTIAIRDIDT